MVTAITVMTVKPHDLWSLFRIRVSPVQESHLFVLEGKEVVFASLSYDRKVRMNTIATSEALGVVHCPVMAETES